MAKKEQVKDMFNNISYTYDRLNHLLSFGIDKCWRRKAIKYLLKEKGDKQFLDIACGTGDFSIDLAKKLDNKSLVNSHISSVDISEGMLEVMKSKVKKENLDKYISILLADGEALPFDDESFDLVSIAFGIRNFEDRDKGLREIYRVLKPNGKLLILELSEPSSKLLRYLYRLYFKKILPKIGAYLSGDKDAYTYLPKSVENFPNKKDFLASLAKASFSKQEHKALSFGICRMYIAIK